MLSIRSTCIFGYVLCFNCIRVLCVVCCKCIRTLTYPPTNMLVTRLHWVVVEIVKFRNNPLANVWMLSCSLILFNHKNYEDWEYAQHKCKNTTSQKKHIMFIKFKDEYETKVRHNAPIEFDMAWNSINGIKLNKALDITPETKAKMNKLGLIGKTKRKQPPNPTYDTPIKQNLNETYLNTTTYGNHRQTPQTPVIINPNFKLPVMPMDTNQVSLQSVNFLENFYKKSTVLVCNVCVLFV